MKFMFTSFLLICFVASIFGEDGCSYKGKSFKVGETLSPPGECITFKCVENGSMNALGCAASTAPDECKKIPQDNSKTYPECCERYEC